MYWYRFGLVNKMKLGDAHDEVAIVLEGGNAEMEKWVDKRREGGKEEIEEVLREELKMLG